MSGNAIPRILDEILQHKRQEIEQRKSRISLSEIKDWADEAGAIRPFAASLADAAASGRPGVIAEIKRASPSKGLLREQFDPIAIARSYQRAGASCLSVLTDSKYFKGSGVVLELARNACSLPVLRKDFIVDPYQVYETRALKSDCLLLIVAALSDDQMAELYELARQLRLDVLVEVHTEQEVQRALRLQPTLLGINNRDLHSFKTDLGITLRLRELVPSECHVVTESGIHTEQDVALMRANGVNSFLVGEAFMLAEDPGQKLKQLFYPTDSN